MRLGLHWRIVLWNLVLVAGAIVSLELGYGPGIFLVFAVLLNALMVWRIRVRLARPLSELTGLIRQSGIESGGVRSAGRGAAAELQTLAGALAESNEETAARVHELSAARVRLESILRAMDEGVLVLDARGRITLTNAATRRLLDVERDLVGRTCLEVFRSDALDQTLRDALRGESVDAVEIRVGPNRVLRVLVSTFGSGPAGASEAAVMVLEDLTEIRRVDRVRRDFVANVSHEFKTPLTSIRGYAETIVAEAADPSHREFADTICRNARYLESLVNDLLVLARIEGEPPSVLEDVDVRSLMREQIALREKLPSNVSKKITVDCPSVVLRADSGRLSIALSNLIDNAIRYNRPEGTIHISCRVEPEGVVIEVADQGYGIPQSELPRIFERFYRVDKARSRNAGGTGLGLAIARHAVESQGGTLSVQSQPGSGSTFQIRLFRSRSGDTPSRAHS